MGISKDCVLIVVHDAFIPQISCNEMVSEIEASYLENMSSEQEC